MKIGRPASRGRRHVPFPAILAIALLVLERVRTSPFGRVLRAIREDAQVAAFAGKDVLKFKVKAFALGGALAGLAGALYAHYYSYIVPEIYVPLLTIYIFLALTEGDNRNIMAAQLAVEALGAGRVVAKINDPVRAAAYADLGLATLCRTTLMGDAVASYLGMPVSGTPGIYPPSGQHPGGEHHELPGPVDGSTPAAASAAASISL